MERREYTKNNFELFVSNGDRWLDREAHAHERVFFFSSVFGLSTATVGPLKQVSPRAARLQSTILEHFSCNKSENRKLNGNRESVCARYPMQMVYAMGYCAFAVVEAHLVERTGYRRRGGDTARSVARCFFLHATAFGHRNMAIRFGSNDLFCVSILVYYQILHCNV